MTSKEPSDELKQIEDALDVLVREAIFEDLHYGQQMGAKRFRIYDRAALAALPTKDFEAEIMELLERPKSAACRWAIRRLGQRIFDLTGSTQPMEDICERVARRDFRSYGCRIDIIDKRWDGIGSGADRWWA